jgi:hypothetical protein
MMIFICDYALISSAVLVDRIWSDTSLEVIAFAEDIDEDTFLLRVELPWEGADEISEADMARILEIVKPYEIKA